MTTLTATYTTIKTLFKHGYEVEQFAEAMADFEKSIEIDRKNDVIAILDEDGVAVDFAHPIIINHKGQRFYELYLSEMNSFFSLDGEHFDTCLDDIEVDGLPIGILRSIRNS